MDLQGVRRLATDLQEQVSDRTAESGDLLHELGYSLQANRKTREGSQHPDRNAEFEYIAAEVTAFQARALPVISVDTKKKELVGEFETRAGNGVPGVSPLACASTTLPRAAGQSHRTASMIYGKLGVG